MKILVSKIGAIFKTRESQRRSGLGEQGETEGVLRWLVAQGHDVTYFGRMEGSVDGVRYVESARYFDKGDIDGSQKDLADKQRAGFEDDDNRLGRDYDHYIHMAGFTTPRAISGQGTRILSIGANYCGPVLHATLRIKAPVAYVNCDPRTYPKSCEYAAWPEMRPRAVFDQWTTDKKTKLGYKPFHIRTVYARVESWAYHEYQLNVDADPAVCVAHAHVDDGTRNSSWSAWNIIHAGELPKDYLVYGTGWPTGPLYQGKVSADDSLELFRLHTCGPVVSHTPGFMTGKPWVMMSRGCIPLFFGDGTHPQTYDRGETIMKLSDKLRIKQPGDLKRIADRLHANHDLRENVRGWLRERMKPDFSLLARYLEDKNPSFETYGGYKCLG